MYFHCGVHTVYGAMPDTPGLDGFYQRAGFTVLDYGHPLNLSVTFGMDFRIRPGNAERLFTRERPDQG